jgi:hypothetical protein
MLMYMLTGNLNLHSYLSLVEEPRFSPESSLQSSTVL